MLKSAEGGGFQYLWIVDSVAGKIDDPHCEKPGSRVLLVLQPEGLASAGQRYAHAFDCGRIEGFTVEKCADRHGRPSTYATPQAEYGT